MTDVDIIVLSSRPDWTFACVKTILQNTEVPAKIYVVPNTEDVHTSLEDCHQAVQSRMLEEWQTVQVLMPQPGVDAFHKALVEVHAECFAIVRDHAYVPSHWLEPLLWPLREDGSITVAVPTLFNQVPTDLGIKRQTVPNIEAVNEICLWIRHAHYGCWHVADGITSTCLVARSTLIDRFVSAGDMMRTPEERVAQWLRDLAQLEHTFVQCEDVYVYILHLPSQRLLPKPCPHLPAQGWASHLPWTAVIPPLVTLVILHASQTEEDLVRTWQSVGTQSYGHIETVLVVYDSASTSSHTSSQVQPDVTLILHKGQSLQSVWQGVNRLCHGTYIGFVKSGAILPSSHVANLVDLLYRGHAAAGAPSPSHSTSVDILSIREMPLNEAPLSGFFTRRTDMTSDATPSPLLWHPPTTGGARETIVYRDSCPYVLFADTCEG